MKDRKLIQKEYFRFLKEYGVFSKAMAIHKGKIKRFNYLGLSDLLDTCDPYVWIQNSNVFCTWSRSDEGDLFWWGVCILWQCECVFKGLHDFKSETLQSKIGSLLVYIRDYDRSFNGYGCRKDLIDKAKEFRSKLLYISENLNDILNMGI